MNDTLYETVFYRLLAQISELEGALQQLMEEPNKFDTSIVEQAYQILLELVNIKAARHELEVLYQRKYQESKAPSPPEPDFAGAMEALLAKVNRIEMHLDPAGSESLSHAELMERSGTYRNSHDATAQDVLELNTGEPNEE
tara:strand:- start:1207 stop:1629 length:423 start_codon:yes stop_codon:yes gene_type:complete